MKKKIVGEVKINYKQIFSCHQRNFRHFGAFFSCPTEISQPFLRSLTFPPTSLSQALSLRSNCLGSLKSTFHLLLAHLLPTKGAWPWQHLEKLCEKCWPIQKSKKKGKYIKEKIPPEVPHLLHSLGTLKLTHKFSSGWPTACGWLSTRYF